MTTGEFPTVDDASDRVLDRESAIVLVTGRTRLDALERALVRDGFTLDLAPGAVGATTVDAWLAEGAPGSRDPFRDPVDHLVAGFEFSLRTGTRIVLRPVPRRSTGPDLLALGFGTAGTIGRFDRVWLRMHALGAVRAESSRFAHDGNPDESDAERAIWSRIRSAFDA